MQDLTQKIGNVSKSTNSSVQRIVKMITMKNSGTIKFNTRYVKEGNEQGNPDPNGP